MRGHGKVWVFVILVVCALACACEPAPDHVISGIDPIPVVRIGQSCGMAFTHTALPHDGYGTPESLRSMNELTGLGVDSISLSVFGWMDSLDAVHVDDSPIHPSKEAFERMGTEVARARELGMHVLVKPHIGIAGDQWAGRIAPSPDHGGWQAWFASYTEFITRVASTAEAHGADRLCVGVELVSSTERHSRRWQGLIDAIRRIFSGALLYCANWNEVEQITFWNELDAIGVQMFAPLASTPFPAQGELDRGAADWLGRYEQVARAFSRPLLLTEVGFSNRVGTAAKPWVWPVDVEQEWTREGDLQQVQAYRAIIHTFGQSSMVSGMYWWRWFTNYEIAAQDPISFSPRGKPAEQTLASACGGISRR